ncbi:MAG: COX15/CtaA family protein, partial [Ginsengibacter sp.]
KNKLAVNSSLKKFTITIVCLLVVQLIYGAFMSGLKAATVAPTWPDINDKMIPGQLNNLSPWWKNLVDNKIAVQLIHRSIAYLLTILVFVWSIKASKVKSNYLLNRTKWLPLIFILLQVVLGILTVIWSPFGSSLVWFGLAHQFTAMLFLIMMIWMIFLVRSHLNLKTISS